MIGYYQETYAEKAVAMPSEFSSLLIYEPPSETSGGSLGKYLSRPLEDLSIVRSAWDTVRQTENQEIAQEARELLSIIREMITYSHQLGADLSHLPPLQAFNVDDGSILIEWIFSDFRIGFSIEPNSEDSGWYLVSNERLGEISAFGFTSSIDNNILVSWLLGFVLANF